MIEVERAVLSGSTAGGFEILERETFISAVSVMELRIGVALASTPERRRARQQFSSNRFERVPACRSVSRRRRRLRQCLPSFGERDSALASAIS